MDSVIYIHGKGGNADEAEFLKPLFNEFCVVGFDYKSQTPWEAKDEFPTFFDGVCKKSDHVILVANSIGAYFSMSALPGKKIDKAFFISPIVDMEGLILGMMSSVGITEDELRIKKEIRTPFGETLSWDYLRYVRLNPIKWDIQTEIAYGENDLFTPYKTMSDFAKNIGAGLTVMNGGEHWFHTDEQMNFLASWIKSKIVCE